VVRDRDADRDGVFDELGPGDTSVITLPSDFYSFAPAISDNGRIAVYVSRSEESFSHVYVYDRDADGDGILDETGSGETSIEDLGLETDPHTSADGHVVAWSSGGIHVLDRTTARYTELPRGEVNLSADGRYVAFSSDDGNLVAGDTNDASDVFRYDLLTGATIRVSIDSIGQQGDDSSSTPTISADGRYLAFESVATNLAPGDAPLCSSKFGSPATCPASSCTTC
jgi:Tol biopolymer transport system component